MAYNNFRIFKSINITDTFFETIIDNGLPFTKDNEVILICATGDKSKIYSEYLNKKGMNVYSVKGGMIEWREQEKPLVRNIKKLR